MATNTDLQSIGKKNLNMMYSFLNYQNELYKCFKITKDDDIISLENIMIVEKNNTTVTLKHLTTNIQMVTIENDKQQLRLTSSKDISAITIYVLVFLMQKKVLKDISSTEFSFDNNTLVSCDNGNWLLNSKEISTQDLILKCSASSL